MAANSGRRPCRILMGFIPFAVRYEGRKGLSVRRYPTCFGLHSAAVMAPGGSVSMQSIMARHRLDRGDDLVVADLGTGPDERRVAAVHQDREVVLGVAAQGVGEFLPFFGLQGT